MKQLYDVVHCSQNHSTRYVVNCCKLLLDCKTNMGLKYPANKTYPHLPYLQMKYKLWTKFEFKEQPDHKNTAEAPITATNPSGGRDAFPIYTENTTPCSFSFLHVHRYHHHCHSPLNYLYISQMGPKSH